MSDEVFLYNPLLYMAANCGPVLLAPVAIAAAMALFSGSPRGLCRLFSPAALERLRWGAFGLGAAISAAAVFGSVGLVGAAAFVALCRVGFAERAEP
jgi:hypothetical protein